MSPLSVLISKASESDQLSRKLQQVNTPNELISLAKEQGISITASDLDQLKPSIQGSDLESIAGGAIDALASTANHTTCYTACPCFTGC